jgi:hypothetical protein
MTDPVPQPIRPQVGPSREDPHRERFDAPELAVRGKVEKSKSQKVKKSTSQHAREKSRLTC